MIELVLWQVFIAVCSSPTTWARRTYWRPWTTARSRCRRSTSLPSCRRSADTCVCFVSVTSCTAVSTQASPVTLPPPSSSERERMMTEPRWCLHPGTDHRAVHCGNECLVFIVFRYYWYFLKALSWRTWVKLIPERKSLLPHPRWSWTSRSLQKSQSSLCRSSSPSRSVKCILIYTKSYRYSWHLASGM